MTRYKALLTKATTDLGNWFNVKYNLMLNTNIKIFLYTTFFGFNSHYYKGAYKAPSSAKE